MSRAPKRGKLRNPPRGRQYAYVAIVIVLLVAGGSGLYLYGSHLQAVASSSSSSASASSSAASASSASAASNSTAGFVNTPCAPSTTTATTSGSSTQYALICTNLGLIEIELYPQYAPKTVANFVSLADQGFYTDIVWHRIDPGFVIQAGDPNTKNGGGNRTTWGQGGSSTSVPFEGPPSNPLSNVVGSVAMASTAAKAGGTSQFYINLANNAASLDGNYAVFGQVISGMSVVNALAQVPINTTNCSTTGVECDQPVNPADAYIVSVTIQSTP